MRFKNLNLLRLGPSDSIGGDLTYWFRNKELMAGSSALRGVISAKELFSYVPSPVPRIFIIIVVVKPMLSFTRF
jgi:hypothetical protein